MTRKAELNSEQILRSIRGLADYAIEMRGGYDEALARIHKELDEQERETWVRCNTRMVEETEKNAAEALKRCIP